MSDERLDEVERRLYRSHLVAVHVLTELAIAKGLFTREEYRTSAKWFTDAFDRIDAVLATMPERTDVTHPPVELQAIYDEMENRMFPHG